MSIEADIKHYEQNLIKTLDKKLTLQTLKEWRAETNSKEEADVLGDLIYLIAVECELDG